jgi:hypothetical protein
MGLETGTFVADLVPSNPLNADLEGQGAAHLRLIKQVLQNTFLHGSRSVGIPTPVVKTATYVVVQADANSIFLIDTTAALVNLTMPTLTAADAGWEVSVIKTNQGLNPILVKPPSGTLTSGAISGLTATRRCIPGSLSRVIWTGSTFICTRAVQGPVGSCIEYHGAALPPGFELPNGQTLVAAATNYPDYVAAIGSGVTLDRTGRVGAMREAVATRLTIAGSGVDGATLGSAGGAQSVTPTINSFTIAQGQLPNVTLNVTGTTINDVNNGANTTTAVHDTGSGVLVAGLITNVGTQSDALSGGVTGSINGGVGQTAITPTAAAVNDVQPTIVTNLLLVVE